MTRTRTWMAFGAAAVLTVVAVPDRAQAQSGPYQYYAITPCRLVDTRATTVTAPGGTCPAAACNGNNNVKLSGPALPSPRTPANWFVVSNWYAQGLCGIPVGAKAVTVNLTVVGPSAAGDMAMFPAGGDVPQVSSLNFAKNEPALGNGAIVPLGPSTGKDLSLGTYILLNGTATGTAHAVIDVTGYFAAAP